MPVKWYQAAGSALVRDRELAQSYSFPYSATPTAESRWQTSSLFDKIVTVNIGEMKISDSPFICYEYTGETNRIIIFLQFLFMYLGKHPTVVRYFY